jgi:hypothetical protein
MGPQVHRRIKFESSVSRSTTEIKWAKGYSPLLIIATGNGLDGSEHIPYGSGSSGQSTAAPPLELTGVLLFSSYGGQFSVRFAPMGPR